MSSGSSNPPKYKVPSGSVPDPTSTADTQFQYNVKGLVNQNNPFNSVTYSQPDSNGNVTATTSLSPQAQNLFNSGLSLAGTDLQQLGSQGPLNLPKLDLSNTAIQDAIDKLGAARLDPQYANLQEQLDTKLANQGLAPSSKAYQDAQTALGQQRNDAYNQLYLTGQQQQQQNALNQYNADFQNATTAYNAPLSQASSLMGLSQSLLGGANPVNQVGAPNYGGYTYDSAGITNQNAQAQYQAALNAYNQQQQQQQALYGALGSIGGTLGGAFLGNPGVGKAIGGWMTG